MPQRVEHFASHLPKFGTTIRYDRSEIINEDTRPDSPTWFETRGRAEVPEM